MNVDLAESKSEILNYSHENSNLFNEALELLRGCQVNKTLSMGDNRFVQLYVNLELNPA